MKTLAVIIIYHSERERERMRIVIDAQETEIGDT